MPHDDHKSISFLSVLAIVNSPSSISKLKADLLALNNQCTFAQSIHDFLDKLTVTNPDIIIISKMLTHTDTSKVISVLEHHGMPLISFDESDPSSLTLKVFMEKAEAIALQKKPPWGEIIHLLKEDLTKAGHVILSHIVAPVSPTELKIGQTLPFDVMIQMPINHKSILYLKKGTILLKESLERLKSFGMDRVFKRI